MARVKFNVAKITQELTRAVGRASARPAFLKLSGKFITKRIKFRARKGKPLNDRASFPPLALSTKEGRRLIKRAGFKTHPSFSPNKSNLTITGQLVDAIKYRRLSSHRFEIFVEPSQRQHDGDPNNQKLAGFLAKIGFVLFSVRGINQDEKIPRRLKQLMKRFLRRELKTRRKK